MSVPPTTGSVRITDRYRGLEGVRLYEALDAEGRGVPGPRVALIGRQHGNEPVGEAVLERLAGVVDQHLVAGSLLCLLANLDARALNLRHTPDGTDMNRLWDADTLSRLQAADPATLCSEERRVRELAPVVLECDAIFDLHSTSRPSPTHLVLRDDLRHAALAARLGVSRIVTGVHEGAILDGGICSNAGLAAGEHGPRLGFTLEAGQHENPENLDRAWVVVMRLLDELGLWSSPDAAHEPTDFEVYEVIDRFRQAPRGAEPWRFVGYEGGEPGGGRHGPERHLESFETVEADEVVLRRGNDEVLRAEAPFAMLMPAPTAGPGEDLFYFCQRRHAALQVRPQTDAEARVEALAIERMLDLVAWDEAERGATQVSLTSRRTLDLCAALVGRASRLPPGHPHRRITVVGRGDWGGDESEQRATQRWTAALTEALQRQVPVERVQILRGASLGWLGVLTQQMASSEGRFTLRLSTRQPHTVALVVVGDPELALASGEMRHVGVGLVVEAATVEPDGDDVHTRVARAGLFGSRPELVRAALGIVANLRSEHARLVSSGDLGDVSRWRRPDGSLDCVGLPAARILQDRLTALQVDRWRQALGRVVTRPVTVPQGTLGTWLARVVVATGILDVAVLRDWLVRPSADGDDHVIDPGRLQTVPEVLPPASRAMPTPELSADRVGADDIVRWMGWKRYIRDVQVLPGDRGRDLDIAFDGPRIQRRVATWMDDARRLAAAEPGRWMVAIAGDGLSPRRDRAAEGWNVLWAHRRLLLDGNVRYLRIQHAQGTHLAWMKDFIQLVGQRTSARSPLEMGWETEHGGSVNVMLLARCDTDAPVAWSLEDWTVHRCSVLLSHPATDDEDLEYQVAVFTEAGDDGPVNQELAHFGRAHCERLLRQSTWRFQGLGGPSAGVALGNAVKQLVADQLVQLAADRDSVLREGPEDRAAWAAQRLGLLDLDLARALVHAVAQGDEPVEAGRRIWGDVEAWPGPLWQELGRID